MISVKAIKNFALFTLTLGILKIQPWNWNNEVTFIIPLKDPCVKIPYLRIKVNLWKLPIATSLVTIGIAAFPVITYCFSVESDFQDKILVTLYLVSFSIVTETCVFMIRKAKRLHRLANGAFLYDRKLENKFNQGRVAKDEVALIVLICYASTLLPMLLIPVGIYSLFSMNLSFLEPLEYVFSRILFSRIILSLVIGCIGVLGYYYSSLIVAFIIIYTKFVTDWMNFTYNMISSEPSMNIEQLEQISFVYKGFQLLHVSANALFFSLLPSQLLLLCWMVISAVYCTIRYNDPFNFPVTLLMMLLSIVGLFVIVVCIKLAEKITRSTNKFLTVFKHQAIKCGKNYRHLSSSQTLIFKLFGVYIIHERSILIIMNDIIISALINLLVTTR